jgi:hypothetical protein
VQPLIKRCIKNLMALASSISVVVFEVYAIRRMALRSPPGGVKGLATRVAHSHTPAPWTAVQKMVSPAVKTCSSPRKAALRSGAASAAMERADVSSDRESHPRPHRGSWSLKGEKGRF